MDDKQTHTVTETDGTNLMQGLLEVIPLLVFLGVLGGGWFNLQGQVIELRARYESSTGTTRESLSDMKDDIKENTALLRQLLQDNHRNRSPEAIERPVKAR
jgi:hypothetical protein